MTGKITHYLSEARRLPLREILRRAPGTLAREAAGYMKSRRWKRGAPSMPRRDAERIDLLIQPSLALFCPSPDALTVPLRRLGDDARDSIVRSADRTCAGIFDLLGSGPRELGLPPDWHVDFKIGYRFPPEEMPWEARARSGPGRDIKVPWELSRANWLLPLAAAWLLSKDVKYPRTAASLLHDWIEKNPPARGVTWACAMDVGIRAANWAWAVALLRHAPGFVPAFRRKVSASLWTHALFLLDHLERSPVHTSNHYLGDLAGLFHIGLLFREHAQGEIWLRFAWQELQREMEKQVWRDGGDGEASIPYHRLVLEIFAVCAALGQRARLEGARGFWNRLQEMFHFTAACLRPAGQIPQVGDNDSGRLFQAMDRQVNDHRYLAAWGALLFDDAGLKRPEEALSPEALLLFGSQAPSKWEKLPAQSVAKSTVFRDFGIAVLRGDSKGDWLSLFAGPIGQRGYGGHAHNDKLSIELCAGGRPFLVDPGTGCYASDPERRNRFRSTGSHSTLGLEGEEQARYDPDILYRLDEDPKARIVDFEAIPEGGRIIAVHEGWTRLSIPLVHKREVVWDATRRAWRVRDWLQKPDGSAAPTLVLDYWKPALRFILHPDVEALGMSNAGCDLETGGVRLRFYVDGAGIVSLEESCYSREYGVWEPAKALQVRLGAEVVGAGGSQVRLEVL